MYENIFKPFTDHLGKCTGKRVVFYQVQSNAAEIEAMRSGRLHVGGFSTGPTAFAVNLAGAVPFAVKGTEKEFQGYNLIVIVKKDSPYQKLADLKGKKVAHTSPSSNSGHLAPLALFPPEGLAPDKDYKIAVLRQARPVGDGRELRRLRRGAGGLRRVPPHGRARPDQGGRFPHHLPQPEVPDLVVRLRARPRPGARDKMLKCFYDYRFPPEMQKAFDGADRFFPITYQKDWEVVRKVAEGTGEPFNRAAYEKETAREEAARKKALEAKKK